MYYTNEIVATVALELYVHCNYTINKFLQLIKISVKHNK